ncbi:MAG: T9SS type A sorting domain-containing protein [Bacteroidota bacterium]
MRKYNTTILNVFTLLFFVLIVFNVQAQEEIEHGDTLLEEWIVIEASVNDLERCIFQNDKVSVGLSGFIVGNTHPDIVNLTLHLSHHTDPVTDLYLPKEIQIGDYVYNINSSGGGTPQIEVELIRAQYPGTLGGTTVALVDSHLPPGFSISGDCVGVTFDQITALAGGLAFSAYSIDSNQLCYEEEYYCGDGDGGDGSELVYKPQNELPGAVLLSDKNEKMNLPFQEISISPNPASNFVLVETNLEGDADLMLMTTNGQVIYTWPAVEMNGKIRLDLDAYPVGLYILSIISDQQVITEPIIISGK